MITAYCIVKIVKRYLNPGTDSTTNPHGNSAQAQNVLVTNQNQIMGITLPKIPKMNLADLKRIMLMVNSKFRIRPELFQDYAQKVMFIASRLKDDAMDAFYQALEDDPDIILRYEDFMTKMIAA